jgi:hypothetical protein
VFRSINAWLIEVASYVAQNSGGAAINFGPIAKVVQEEYFDILTIWELGGPNASLKIDLRGTSRKDKHKTPSLPQMSKVLLENKVYVTMSLSTICC